MGANVTNSEPTKEARALTTADNARIRTLEEYLTSVEASAKPPPIRGGRLLRRLPKRAPAMYRGLGTRAVRPFSRRQLARLRGRQPLKLHLGCGWIHKEGWVNLDLFATRADIAWDLRLGLPLPDNSVDAIFHEHLLEHLSLRDGFAVTRECHRVLRGGACCAWVCQTPAL
jgi:Methyltransferase domain